MPNLALKFRNPFAMFAPAYPEANIETKYKSPLVPLPTNAFIPQRDLDKTPVLEVSHLGIDFGGLTAVDDFNLTIGRTEIAGLIGRTARARPRSLTSSPRSTSRRAALSWSTA